MGTSRTREQQFALVVLALFLAAYFCRFAVLQREYAADGWVTGDWLINYSAGFVRRGLLGELYRQAWLHGRVDPIALVLATKFAMCGAFCVLTIALAARLRTGAIEVLLWLAPWSVTFDLMWSGGTGRKEALLFVVAAWAALVSARSRARLLLVALPLLIFVHEGLIFFFPLLALPIVAAPVVDRRVARAFAIGFGGALVVFGVSALFRGTSEQAAAICQSVVAFAHDAGLCQGGISSLDHFDFTIHEGYYRIFVPLMALTLAPIAAYAAAVLEGAARRRFFTALPIALAATLPLYALGADWGRWIHASALLTLLAVWQTGTRRVALANLPAAAAAALVIAAMAYTLTWRLPNFIGDATELSAASSSFARWKSGLFEY